MGTILCTTSANVGREVVFLGSSATIGRSPWVRGPQCIHCKLPAVTHLRGLSLPQHDGCEQSSEGWGGCSDGLVETDRDVAE
jgi:hypothetical protein